MIASHGQEKTGVRAGFFSSPGGDGKPLRLSPPRLWLLAFLPGAV